MSSIGGVADQPACSTLDPHVSKNPCVLCGAVAYCCGAVGPRPIAALLGRFLPRLGPLVHSSGPFFFSWSSRGARSASPESILIIVVMDSGLATSSRPGMTKEVLY